MEFLTGAKLTKAIKELLHEPEVRCAVAFWGKGCDEWLAGNSARVICNLRSGGTNPHALEKLQSVDLRQYDTLHAKVIIGKTHSIVGSANISTNGLGFEGIETTGWHEAGMRLDTSDELTSWFEDLWKNQSRPILPNDWKEAKKKWKLRQSAKPTLPNFGSFDIAQKRLPFLEYPGDTDYEENQEGIEEQIGRYDQQISSRLRMGSDIDDERDVSLLKDRWILSFEISKKGKLLTRPLYFTKLSKVRVKKSHKYNGEGQFTDALLAEETQTPQPFDPNKENFRTAFFQILSLERYRNFRDLDYKKSYYQPCVKIIKPFWRDVRAAYKQLS